MLSRRDGVSDIPVDGFEDDLSRGMTVVVDRWIPLSPDVVNCDSVTNFRKVDGAEGDRRVQESSSSQVRNSRGEVQKQQFVWMFNPHEAMHTLVGRRLREASHMLKAWRGIAPLNQTAFVHCFGETLGLRTSHVLDEE